ncbi:MAG: pyridoxal-dependent decarboxylase [Pseudomonadota bacterium]
MESLQRFTLSSEVLQEATALITARQRGDAGAANAEAKRDPASKALGDGVRSSNLWSEENQVAGFDGQGFPLNKDDIEEGLGAEKALALLQSIFAPSAADLSGPTAFAHMDPPAHWPAVVAGFWAAASNQNLLHPATSPRGVDFDAYAISLLTPYFGMNGGHMTAGSSLANLTALWAARKVKGVRRVIASTHAHLSIAKAADLLGLELDMYEPSADGSLDLSSGAIDCAGACVVLTAGTTSAGAIDRLRRPEGAQWLHIDAAWAGPLRLTTTYSHRLDGVEQADSIALSAHKWLFQAKESALVMFSDADAAHGALSFGGAYLASPNIGVLGSKALRGLPLLATLISLGRRGIDDILSASMGTAERVARAVRDAPSLKIFAEPQTGVVLWRPATLDRWDAVRAALPEGFASEARLGDTRWFRQVAANPQVNEDAVLDCIARAAHAAQ